MMQSLLDPTALSPAASTVAAGLAAAVLLLWLVAVGLPPYRKDPSIPTPWMWDLALKSAATASRLDWMGLARQFGPVFRCRFMFEPVLLVSGPAEVRELLHGEHDLVAMDLPPALKRLIGPLNLANMRGKEHLREKRLLSVAFTPANLRGYLPSLQALAEECCARWASQGRISGYEELRFFVIRVAVDLLMGFDASWTSPERFELMSRCFNDLWEGFVSVPIDLPGSGYRRAKHAKQELDQLFLGSLQQLVESGTLDAAPQEAPSDTQPAAGFTMLELLLRVRDDQGQPLPRERVLAASASLMIGAVDTTATTLLMLVRRLCANPHVVEQLRAEQRDVMEAHGQKISDAALRAMRYADAVVKEVLRLDSPTTLLFRRALKSFSLGPYHIERGEKILLSVFAAMSAEPRWAGDDPQCFKPERWLPEGARTALFLPFSGGPRICPGMQLAMNEIKVMTAVLVRGYEVELLNPGEKWKSFPLMRPANGMPLRVTPIVAAA